MTSDLHERLLTATEPGAAPPWPWRVVRAVVELHAPVALPILREGLAPWLECGHCVDSLESDGETLAHADWPCETVQAIARELGVEVAS